MAADCSGLAGPGGGGTAAAGGGGAAALVDEALESDLEMSSMLSPNSIVLLANFWMRSLKTGGTRIHM